MTSVVLGQNIPVKGKRISYGTFTNTTGGSGGEIVTYLSTVETLQILPKGTSVAGSQCVVNETFPRNIATGTCTIVTADVDGYWFAVGL